MAEFRSENVEIVDGDLVIKDASGTERVRIEGATGSVTVLAKDGTAMVVLTETGSVQAGGTGEDGDLELLASGGNKTVHLGAEHPQLLFENPDDASRTVELDGRNATLSLGGTGHDGTIAMQAATGDKTVHVGSLRPQLLLRHPASAVETVKLDGHEAELSLRHPTDGTTLAKIDGGSGNLTLGGVGQDGDLYVQSSGDARAVEINGNQARVALSHPDDGVETVQLDGLNGNITLGGSGHDGDLFVEDSSGNRTIHISGESGDIILKNADCAEDFDLASPAAGEPGTVLVLGDDAALRECAEAYDRRVVGVVSGAGSHRPGIVLDRRASASGRAPVALMGKVYCKADAEHAPIRPGDLLTTSPTAGHAMKADAGQGAAGTVLGKALARLDTGRGLIPILVTLQ